PTSRRKRAPVVRTVTRASTPPSRHSRWSTFSIASSRTMRIETRARARALQALYAWEMRGGGGAGVGGADGRNLGRVGSQVWDGLGVTPGVRGLVGLMCGGGVNAG